MKPHLLLLLLLAIPPLICNILACANAEKSATPPALSSEASAKGGTANSFPAPKDSPAPAAPAIVTLSANVSAKSTAEAGAPANAKTSARQGPAHSGGAPGLKAWYTVW